MIEGGDELDGALRNMPLPNTSPDSRRHRRRKRRPAATSKFISRKWRLTHSTRARDDPHLLVVVAGRAAGRESVVSQSHAAARLCWRGQNVAVPYPRRREIGIVVIVPHHILGARRSGAQVVGNVRSVEMNGLWLAAPSAWICSRVAPAAIMPGNNSAQPPLARPERLPRS